MDFAPVIVSTAALQYGCTHQSQAQSAFSHMRRLQFGKRYRAMTTYNMFYKIQIEKDGFYCRTNPFDGKYYQYREISNYKLIEERKKFGSVRGRGVRETHYFYYLIFTDSNNKTHKVLYNKALFEREMKVLVSRIEQAQG